MSRILDDFTLISSISLPFGFTNFQYLPLPLHQEVVVLAQGFHRKLRDEDLTLHEINK